MATAITLEVLPAAYGDAIWIECAQAGRPWRMIIDGGPPEASGALATRAAALPAGERFIDVVVVSHIDSDHIGGMLPFLQTTDVGIGDVWFNGLPQLPSVGDVHTRSVNEGEDLIALLTGSGRDQPLPWNRVVDGTAIVTEGDTNAKVLPLDAEPMITLLSPTPKRLRALRRVWEQALARAVRGESEEVGPPAPPEPLTDLEPLAASVTRNDTSIPNGSSIAFLLEHRGASCLFGADAFPTVLGGALWTLANARGGKVVIDAVKLPHHGSQKNVSAKLLSLVDSKNYLVSTNGAHFGHPDDVALARAVVAGGETTTLWFNYPASDTTSRWAEPALGGRYRLTTEFAADGIGTCLELPART